MSINIYGSNRHRTIIMLLLTVIILCFTAHCARSIAYDITTSTPDWQSILYGLKAGDIVTMHQGTYVTTGSGYFQLTLNGKRNRPIIIQAARKEARPVIQSAQVGDSAQNVVNIQGSNFMVKGLAFTHGSRGVRLGPARECKQNSRFSLRYIILL